MSIAGTNPGCTQCSGPAMEWNRCACGVVFALCGDHGQPGAARRARVEHERSCRATRVWDHQRQAMGVRSAGPAR